MRRKNAAVLMTAVIIGGLLTSCGSAYNNANGKNSDNTVETQTTVRTESVSLQYCQNSSH